MNNMILYSWLLIVFATLSLINSFKLHSRRSKLLITVITATCHLVVVSPSVAASDQKTSFESILSRMDVVEARFNDLVKIRNEDRTLAEKLRQDDKAEFKKDMEIVEARRIERENERIREREKDRAYAKASMDMQETRTNEREKASVLERDRDRADAKAAREVAEIQRIERDKERIRDREEDKADRRTSMIISFAAVGSAFSTLFLEYKRKS